MARFVTEAELRGVLLGLQLFRFRNIRCLIIEGDDATIMSVLSYIQFFFVFFLSLYSLVLSLFHCLILLCLVGFA